MDINNPKILIEAAKTNLNIILSTGFSNLQEISRAIDCILKEGIYRI